MKSKSGLCLLVLALSGMMQIVLADNVVAAIFLNSGIGMAMRFQRQAEQIVEWKLNDLRVKQERVLMQQAGHAVPLPSGVCSAVIGVSATGSVTSISLLRCASADLWSVFVQAIEAAKLPPFGLAGNITVLVDA
ncbi:MAG: hypothetical protein ACYCSS_14315 [Sulfuriferula sp.]